MPELDIAEGGARAVAAVRCPAWPVLAAVLVAACGGRQPGAAAKGTGAAVAEAGPKATAPESAAHPCAAERPDGAAAVPDRSAVRWRKHASPDRTEVEPATTDRYFIGSWRAVDDDQWIYWLEVFGDMRYTERIDRPDGTDCVQHGKIWLEGRQLFWYYDVNTCNTDYEGRSDPDPVIAADRDAFTIDLDSYTLEYERLGAGLDE